MSDLLPCPKCHSEFTYEDSGLYICPECAHEWPKNEKVEHTNQDQFIVRDAHRNLLNEGDFVTPYLE